MEEVEEENLYYEWNLIFLRGAINKKPSPLKEKQGTIINILGGRKTATPYMELICCAVWVLMLTPNLKSRVKTSKGKGIRVPGRISTAF